MASEAEIKYKEKQVRSNMKYAHMIKDKPVIHQGETVADFLARGGTINKVDNMENEKTNECSRQTK